MSGPSGPLGTIVAVVEPGGVEEVKDELFDPLGVADALQEGAGRFVVAVGVEVISTALLSAGLGSRVEGGAESVAQVGVEDVVKGGGELGDGRVLAGIRFDKDGVVAEDGGAPIRDGGGPKVLDEPIAAPPEKVREVGVSGVSGRIEGVEDDEVDALGEGQDLDAQDGPSALEGGKEDDVEDLDAMAAADAGDPSVVNGRVVIAEKGAGLDGQGIGAKFRSKAVVGRRGGRTKTHEPQGGRGVVGHVVQ